VGLLQGQWMAYRVSGATLVIVYGGGVVDAQGNLSDVVHVARVTHSGQGVFNIDHSLAPNLLQRPTRDSYAVLRGTKALVVG
jgi:hypothetical protein